LSWRAVEEENMRSGLPALAFAATLLGALAIAGCAKDTVKPRPVDTNPNTPNANQRIVSQQKFGGADAVSSIWRLESSDGSQRFSGPLNDVTGAGGLGASGNLLWHLGTRFEPNDIEVLPSTSPMPGATLVVGGYDSNQDGYNEVGYAALVTAAGTEVNRVPYGSDTTAASLNAIAALSDSEFVAAGWEQTTEGTFPVVVRLVVTAADTLEGREWIVLSTLPNQYAIDVATDPADALSPQRRIYLATESTTGATIATLHGLDITASTLAPWTLAWAATLPGKGHGTWEHGMKVLGGDLYVAGEAQDPDKTPRPADQGQYWSSGLAARLSRDGAIEWAQVVSETNEEDLFWAVEPTATAVIAIGNAGGFVTNGSGNASYPFGYGWVTRLAPADGATLAHLTFGDASTSSGFNDGTMVGPNLQVGGFTDETSGGLRAWWCSLNVEPSAGTASARVAAPVPYGARSSRTHQRQGAPPMRQFHLGPVTH
jgi:hypothetical protein